VASADYHRRRPTARQLDEVFWLEEERVVSEDWVVRYHNRLLQVKRHLVCKRWTIEKADENSNDTPWFALHRPNSDKLRFHLPSLP